MKAVTNLPVFGMVLKNKQTEKGNRIDRWIDSWFAHGRKSEDTELLLMRISHEVAMLAEQKNMQHLLLTVYESNGEETREYAEDLAEKLSELGMTVTCTDGLISNNTEVLKQLEYADGAVFVEQLMKSDRKDGTQGRKNRRSKSAGDRRGYIHAAGRACLRHKRKGRYE